MGIEPQRDATVNWWHQDIENEGIFYTDSNGLEIIKRTKRMPTEKYSELKMDAPINFYPVNSAIFIENVNKDT